MKTLDISVPDGGGAGGAATPPGRNSNSSGGKALRRNKKGYPHESTKAKEKIHETHDFLSNNLGGEVNMRMQKVISSLTYLVIQSRLSS